MRSTLCLVCLCSCSQTGLQPHYWRGVWLPSGQRRREDGQAADLGHGRPGAIPVRSQPLCVATVFQGLQVSGQTNTPASLPTAPSRAATTEEPPERCWFTTLPGKAVAASLLHLEARGEMCGDCSWWSRRNPESSGASREVDTRPVWREVGGEKVGYREEVGDGGFFCWRSRTADAARLKPRQRERALTPRLAVCWSSCWL